MKTFMNTASPYNTHTKRGEQMSSNITDTGELYQTLLSSEEVGFPEIVSLGA